MPTAGPVVAVIDDESEMRKALHRLLTIRGFRVLEYACGEELIENLDTTQIDFLLLDLHMPGMTGFEVLELLHTRPNPIPIIIVTAHDEPDTEKRVRALGACAYLKKPVDREVLFEAIATAPSQIWNS